MQRRVEDPVQMLRDVAPLPATERVPRLRALFAEDPRALCSTICDAVERLVVADVTLAQLGGMLAVELAEQAGADLERARAQRVLGQSLAYAGEFASALDCFQRSISLAEQAGLDMEAARARMSSIHALSEMGAHERARAAAHAARDTFQRLGEPRQAARVDANLGTVTLAHGRPAQALEYLTRARDALADEPVAAAQIDSNRGKALMLMDRHAEAGQVWEAALQTFLREDLPWAAAIVEGNLAELRARQGKLQMALEHFERTRQHLEQEAAPAELARLLTDHAEVLALSGLTHDAARIYREALPILESSGNRVETAKAALGLAEASLRLDRVADTQAHIEKAEQALNGLEQNLMRARAATLRAELLLRTNQFAEAESHALRALAYASDRPVSTTIARLTLGRINRAAGNWHEAREHIRCAAQSAAAVGVAALLAEVLQDRGELHAEMGRQDDALEDLKKAVRLIERVRGTLQSERFRTAFHARKLEAYDLLIALALTGSAPEKHLALAFETAERAKSRSLLEAARRTIVGSEPEAGEEGLAQLENHRATLDILYSQVADERFAEGASPPADRVHSIRELENEVAELESRLVLRRGGRGFFAAPMKLGEVQAALREQEALVQFCQVRDSFAAFVVRRQSVHVTSTLADMPAVTQAVDRVLFQIRRGLRTAHTGTRAQRALADARRELASLGALLLAPLREFLQDTRRLRLVPHGVLHAAPLHAAILNDRYLIEDFEIVFAPSASLSLRSEPARLAGMTHGLIVGVADERAPQIQDEVQSLATLMPGATLIANEDATVRNVREAVSGVDLLHLACHGQFSPDLPEASGVRLADRWWTVREIQRQRLRARLVTLSGCETGRTSVSRGDEVMGLLRSFLSAGAESLVLSQWTVADQSAVSLMRQFYERLLSPVSKLTYSEALRAAQLGQMAHTAHPAHWAAFLAMGG